MCECTNIQNTLEKELMILLLTIFSSECETHIQKFDDIRFPFKIKSNYFPTFSTFLILISPALDYCEGAISSHQPPHNSLLVL